MIEHSDQGVCAQCHRDCHEQPRQLDGNETLWLHAECEAAFLQRGLAEEGLAGANNDAAPSSSLKPHLVDINKHLFAIFSPDFVKDYPEAWIEIAVANPTAGKGKTGPRSARPFPVFELEKAAAYAVRMNKMGRNVYVGMALRQGETGPSGRATKDNVITASRGWADFDKQGDDARINSFLQQHGLRASEVIQTGSIPHIRLQVFFKLESPVTLGELEAVNAALRDQLGGNGDGVQNCDRIMRLAGTVSYPPPNKVERGYVPELTKLISNPRALAYRPATLIGLLTNAPGAPLGKAATGAAAGTGSNGARASSSSGGATSDDKTFWRRVNDLALANLGAWVPLVFPDAKYQKGTGAYRVLSEDLVRNFEEDLSIHPKGITDWGIDDQGKKGEKIGRRTAIDIVIEHGGAADAKAAAFWLCERCGVDPASLGWSDSGKGATPGDDESPPLSADEAWDPWHETPAPRLDMALLPEVIREAATISARVSGADIDAFAIGYLVGLSACGDTRLRVTPKQHATDWSVPLLLWVLLVAPPSSMKSEVIKAARAMAASLDMAERERHTREISFAEVGPAIAAIEANTKLSKADAKKAREEAVEKVAPPRQRICGDITIEKYVDILGDNPGGVAMFRDELSGWLGSLGRYSANGKDGADRAFYCALRDGSAHDRQRMSSPDVHLPHCAGGFFGAVQPDRLLDMDLPMSDGLLQRFMPVIMREAQPYEDSDDVGDAKGLLRPVRDRLAKLVPVMQEDPYGQTVAVPYKLECEGAKLYQRFANDMRLAGRAQEPSREFGECLQKMGPMWLSLALLFHLIETDAGTAPASSVPFEAARRADAIIREYFIPHAEQFYDLLSGGSMRLRGVASAILRCPKDEIVLRDVVRRCHAMQKMDRNEHIKLMQRFETFGWLTRIDRHGNAHPRWTRTSGLGERFEEDLQREVAARAAVTATIKAQAGARKAPEGKLRASQPRAHGGLSLKSSPTRERENKKRHLREEREFF